MTSTRIKKTIFWIFIIFIIGLTAYNYYPEKELPPGVEVDYLLVLKSKKQLITYSEGEVVKTYAISLGEQPVGGKEFEGDLKTPEGVYYINDKSSKSRYHKNLGISYPDSSDLANARRLGRPAGGDIKIHGLRNGLGFIGKYHRLKNWTLGCIAVTNPEIEELYSAVKIGAKIEIKP